MLVLVGAGLALFAWRSQPKVEVIDSIAVLPFANTSADSESEYLSDGITDSGQRAEAQKSLKELQERATREFVDPYYVAIIYLGLGDQEQTFDWLDKACEERSLLLLFLKVEPKFDCVRSDARFVDLARRVGLSSSID